MNTKHKIKDAALCGVVLAAVNTPVSAGNAIIGHLAVQSNENSEHDMALLVASAASAGMAAGLTSGAISSYIHQLFNEQQLLSREAAHDLMTNWRAWAYFGVLEMTTFLYMMVIHDAMQERGPNGKFERAGEFAVGSIFSTKLFALCTVGISCCKRAMNALRTQRHETGHQDVNPHGLWSSAHLDAPSDGEDNESTPLIEITHSK